MIEWLVNFPERIQQTQLQMVDTIYDQINETELHFPLVFFDIKRTKIHISKYR